MPWGLARHRCQMHPGITSPTKSKHVEHPMSAIQSPQAPPNSPAQAPAAAPTTPPADRRRRFRPGHLIALAALIALTAVGLPLVMRWVEYRRGHSITDDAFVEAHIVNIAPQLV